MKNRKSSQPRRLGWFLGGLAALALGLGLSAPAEATISIEVKTEDSKDAPVAESVELYQSSYALVIGMDDYAAGWPKLRNAVKDAEEVANGLKSLGFEVTSVSNLDAEGLRKTIKEFFVLKGAQPGARLLVWFAGHGHSDNGEGFLVPVDGPAPGDPAFALYALPMRDFGTLMRLARSKHVLAIFDSCFSGTIFEARAGAVPAAITRATLSPVRQFLSSGDADQTVADNGSFRELFLRAVRGEENADANGDGYLTGTELGGFLADRVTNLTHGAQTPRFGKLLDVNYDRGDFVFVLPNRKDGETLANLPAQESKGEGTRSIQPDNATALELAFWNSIKDSRNTADFEAYIEKFPTGTFTSLARNRMASLKSEMESEALDPGPNAAQDQEPGPSNQGNAKVAGGPLPLEQGDPPVIDACDRAAAQPEDPMRVVKGVYFDQVEKKALQACEAAVKKYPNSARMMYQYGRALSRKFDTSPNAKQMEESALWFSKAAEKDYPAAMAALGTAYKFGNGVPHEYDMAAAWYAAGAALGHMPSQYELGTMFEDGLGVDADMNMTLLLYHAAAEQGYGRAQLRLADLYSSGMAGTVEPVAALAWYSIALKSLPADDRAGAVERRDALIAGMSDDDKAQADQAVKAWKPSSWAQLLANDPVLKETITQFSQGQVPGVDMSAYEVAPEAGGTQEQGLDLSKE